MFVYEDGNKTLTLNWEVLPTTLVNEIPSVDVVIGDIYKPAASIEYDKSNL